MRYRCELGAREDPGCVGGVHVSWPAPVPPEEFLDNTLRWTLIVLILDRIPPCASERVGRAQPLTELIGDCKEKCFKVVLETVHLEPLPDVGRNAERRCAFFEATAQHCFELRE